VNQVHHAKSQGI